MSDKYSDQATRIIEQHCRMVEVTTGVHEELRVAIAEALRETHARGIADLLELILTADREKGAGFDTLASATWDHIVACARKASRSIGTRAICSRCGGKDPACYVCGSRPDDVGG